MLFTCSDSKASAGRLNIENGHSPCVGLLKYKRRKVSSVRDFPPGCGRFAVQRNLSLTKRMTDNGTFENSFSMHHEVSGSMEMPDESTEKNPSISFILKNGHNLVNAESLLLTEDFDGDKDGVPKSMNSVGHEASSRDLCQVDVTPMKEEMLQPSMRPDSPAANCSIFVPNDEDVKKLIVKEYPPRREVSAIRDFPPHCGQNAPPLYKEECTPLRASPNIRATDQENSGAHYKSSNWDNKAECVLGNAHAELDITPNEARKGLDKLGKGIAAYTGDMTPKDTTSGMPFHQKPLQVKPFAQILASERLVVLGLMASPNCPWRQGKSDYNPSPVVGISERKMKKSGSRQLENTESISKGDAKAHCKKSSKKKATIENGAANGDVHQQVIARNADVGTSNNENIDLHANYRSCNTDVSLIPFSQINQSGNDGGINSKGTRTKVRETLRLFQAVCRKLLQEEEAVKKVPGNASRRVDLIAAKILKDKEKYVNVGKQILGSVPGVEVGDEFRYRMELNIIGLHRQTQGGIDYVKHGRKILATSIVASGGYTNNLDNSDVLIYTGQGGNVMNSDKKPEDQKLERGNLALKNSFDEKSPVRVIRGSDTSDGRTYVYDGLYLVEKWWQDLGPHGKLVFKFQLCRISGQPELAWKELKKSKKTKVREGLCVDDISQGKESIPICAVNILDDEKPPPFNYITRMIYPDWCRPIPLKGCDCTNGCSDSERCSCAVLNGGEIPFNHNGAIVEAKSLVYECGPSCKCPPSCHNRVSQRGMKFQLEIFKTKSRGWGVRSLNSIPSGSFICEYIGELLEDKEAEQRTGNDEYLFDIGNNYSDNSLWDGLSNLLPDVQTSACSIVEGSFTIDAAKCGNIGRFINHSCSPNLYAQNVLYDHEDKRIPHIMFFAAENIPPLQELSYHYNYMMDQVRDSNGDVKKKRCHCGSVECDGWMY